MINDINRTEIVSDSIVENLIEQAIGLEHVLFTNRDQICQERILKHNATKKYALDMLKVCNPESRKEFKLILKNSETNIKKYRMLEKQNNQSRLITRLFEQQNRDVGDKQLDRFKDNSQDLYYEFSSLLMDAYSLKKPPVLKAALLLESKEGGFKYKKKKYLVTAK